MSTPQDPTQAPPDPNATEKPQVLGGRYEIHRKIARGGMAEVFLARDRSLDRPVAVKVLFPEFATDPSFVERFRREAQAAANLTHPNIVGVYDWGAQSGTYFIVMEFVDGQSLAEVARAAGPLHPRRAAEIAFEVAGALGFAHSRGVVHRDVKPGNVLIATTGQAKVTDFGIARALSSPSEDLTQAGSVMGTATYFSPEQAQGFAVDARSDLYSLGVVLYETVCGRPPFTGETPVAIAYKHVQEAPPRPSSIVSGIPEGLEAIIGKLLAKNPDDRYLSADDLRADLRRYLEGETPDALEAYRRPVAGAAAAGVAAGALAGSALAGADATTVQAAVGGPPVDDADHYDDEEEDHPANTGKFVIALVVLLAIAGVLVFWIVKSLNEEDTAATGTVPNLIGLSREEAEQQTLDAGFTPNVTEEPNDTAPEGEVFDQSPQEGDELEKGKDVLIKVSTGPGTVRVLGNLVGLSATDATKLLEAAGFTVVQREEENADIAAGKVIGTDPPADTEVEAASQVTLIVSIGMNNTAIPTVAGRTQDQARTALRDAGFVVGDVSIQPSTEVEKGRVMGTDPSGSAPKGATVNLIVSGGPSQVAVPSVKGQSESAATQAIQARGLDVNVSPKTLTAGDPNIGRVIEQDPAGGTNVDPGSTVTITVGVAGSSPTTTTTTTSP
jgi:beta-lactam-binding protein with PASTA domain/predicted Ser/Thr protein kinase